MPNRGDVPSFRRIIDDIAEVLKSAPQDGLPRFLAAISWGGKLAVGLNYRHPGLIDGLILLCPGIVSKVRPPFITRMRIALARVFRPGKFFPIPLNDSRLFTASQQWQQFVDNDQLRLRFATARLLFASFALDIYMKRAWKTQTTPTLLLLAEHDDIIDNEGVQAYVEKFPTTDKQVNKYFGAHHTLEFEADNHPWIADLIGWLKSHGCCEARIQKQKPV